MIVATTGFFDGVHRGHRFVLDKIVSQAKLIGAESAVITFWPHPRSVLQQDADELSLLTTLEEKKNLLLGYGIDHVCIMDFNKVVSQISTELFLKDYIIGKYGVTTLVIGYDHRFGKMEISLAAEGGREEDELGLIEKISTKYGLNCIRVDEFSEDGIVYSSTMIRRMLSNGDISEANIALGYRYGLEGVVVAGRKFGRTIGFPTANMRLFEPRKVIPSNGVYLVWVEVLSKTYKGICNIGIRPTLDNGSDISIEIHILDFDEDIYGLDIKIEFEKRMRDEKKFDSIAFLQQQLKEDKDWAYSFIQKGLVNLR